MVISIFSLKTQTPSSLSFTQYFVCSSDTETKGHKEQSESKTLIENLELCKNKYHGTSD